MDPRLRMSLVLAAPLCAAAVASLGGVRARDDRLALAPAAVEHCRRAAELLHDVTWAVACTARKSEDAFDCMLPDDVAARVNAVLHVEESRCLAIEAHARQLR